MREIKFRMWDKTNKKWVLPEDMYQFSDEDEKALVRYLIIGYSSGGIMHIYGDVCNVKVVQYTGLKDKNGKEIYEGYIVNLNPLGYMNGGAVVVWSDDEGCWIYRRIYNDTGVYAYKWRDVEVIGNIYSNPELLSSIPRKITR